MRPWRSAVLGIGLALATVPSVQAGFFYSFTNVGDVAPNGSQTVNVFLNWDGAGTNNLASPGLQEGDTGLRFSATGGATVAVTIPTGVTFNADFTDFTAVDGPLNSGFTVKPGLTNLAAVRLADLAPFVTTGGPGNVGGSPTSLYIASFTLNAGPSFGTVTVEADRRNLGGVIQNIVDGNGTNLDSLVTSGSATFNVVPEPGSMMLVGVATVGFGCRVWRRRQSARTAGSSVPEVI